MTAPSVPSPAEMYEQFYGPAIFQPLAEKFIEFVGPRSGEQVLDVACGTGFVARRVAPLVGEAGRVVAVDINPNMLAVARSQPAPEGGTIEWVEGDAVALDLPEHEFDVVLCQQGLQFFSDRLAALRGLRGLLAPGGRIGIAVWQGIDRQTLFAEFAEVEALHLAPLGVPYEDLVAPFALGDAEELRGLLEEAGFADIEIEPREFEASFPEPETFARKMETAYGAVIPAFVADPEAFEAFVSAVERETREHVRRYSDGAVVRFPMPTYFAVAQVADAEQTGAAR
jgi:ubiquinone/menaquinone biosynthesis C-methylase UbiE